MGDFGGSIPNFEASPLHPCHNHVVFCGGREFLASGVNMHEFSGRLNCKGTRFLGNASVFL